MVLGVSWVCQARRARGRAGTLRSSSPLTLALQPYLPPFISSSLSSPSCPHYLTLYFTFSLTLGQILKPLMLYFILRSCPHSLMHPLARYRPLTQPSLPLAPPHPHSPTLTFTPLPSHLHPHSHTCTLTPTLYTLTHTFTPSLLQL